MPSRSSNACLILCYFCNNLQNISTLKMLIFNNLLSIVSYLINCIIKAFNYLYKRQSVHMAALLTLLSFRFRYILQDHNYILNSLLKYLRNLHFPTPQCLADCFQVLNQHVNLISCLIDSSMVSQMVMNALIFHCFTLVRL